MEMGKLTAKLRDAVPVCLLVEGKEIKRYRNIDIPDELKILEYQDFIFDVSLNGTITFKIMFEPGVLPEVFPQLRERRKRVPKETPIVSEVLTSKPDEDKDEQNTVLTTQEHSDLIEEILAKNTINAGEGSPDYNTKDINVAKKVAGKPKKTPTIIIGKNA